MLKQNDSETARWIARFVEPWLAFKRRIFFRRKGFFPWDVVAAATLIDDSLFDTKRRAFSVRERGLRRGSLILLSFSDAGPSAEEACRANVPESRCAERFMDVFLSRLLDLTENATNR